MKQTLIRLTLRLLAGLGFVKKSLDAFIIFGLGRPFSWVGRLVFRIMLPMYSRYVIFKQRIKAHPYFVGLESVGHFLQRYSLYVGLVLLGLFVTGNNLFARTIRPDEVGQGAIWVAFVQGDNPELIVETTLTKTLAADPGATTAVGGPPAVEGETRAAAVVAETTPTLALGQDTVETDGTSNGSIARTDTVQYTVEGGDTISTIAQKFGLTMRTILWANNLGEQDFIKPGQVLKIPPKSGVLYAVKSGDTVSSIAQRYKGNEQEILQANGLAIADALQAGTEIIIPNGEPPAPPASTPAAPQRGFIGRVIVRNEAPPPAARATGARFIWPAPGRRINQYFRGRYGHSGLDIECNYNNPLYAAAGGTVSFASADRSGYGLHVIINHGNGYQTLYGHASKVFVRAGQTVSQGQTIAMCGSTGRSTGTHLHFEIRSGGSFLNPLSFY